MEAARPRARRRRLGREGTGAALDGRLVRVGLLVVVPGLAALLLAMSTPGALPKPALSPLFDGRAAGVLAGSFALAYPTRVPGSPEAEEATRWYRETIAGLGIPADEDRWTEHVAGLGEVALTNVVTVVPGKSQDVILVVAHRDNAGVDERSADNASGTAALIELARSFAPQETGASPVPQHTLVFLSTDAGAYGGAGAEHFAKTSPLASRVVAGIVLERIELSGRPRLGVASDTVASPPRALVGTARARVLEWVGETPALAYPPTQLLDLATPLALAEQGRLLGNQVPALTLTTSGPIEPESGVAVPGRFPGTARIGRMGKAAEALIDSLDTSVTASGRTHDRLFFGDRAVEGWAVRLTLVLLIVPIALGTVDLVARARRRGLRLRPAARALRARLLVWIAALLVILGLGALIGAFPRGADLPLPPYTPVVADPPVLRLVLLVAAAAFVWRWASGTLRRRRPVTEDERLAGLAVALIGLLVLAVVLSLLKPYALVFVLPALYAWPWIPLGRTSGRGALLFVVGLLGPLLGLVLLANQVGVSLIRAPLYFGGLVTVGYVSLWTALGLVVLAAVGSQFGALAFGRYSPYADGAEPPPPGFVRTTVARVARTLRR